jgi:DNA-binding transcriptional LysR family regulator
MLKAFATSLAYFAAIARLRSVRRAAEALRIAPSALSRQIRQIEERLDVQLFERSQQGVHLTPAGEVLLTYLDRWEKDFTGLNEALRGLTGLRLGTLTLASVESATYSVVPRAIGALRERMPGMTINMSVGVTGTILKDVAEGRAEIGVVINMPRASGVKSAWAVRNPVGAVVPAGHPLARLREITLAECLTHPVILPDKGLVVHFAIQRALERAGHGVRIAATSNRIVSIKSLVTAGLGLTFMTHLDVASEVTAGVLSFVRLKDRDVEPPLYSLVIPRRSRLSSAGALLLELLRRELGRETNRSTLSPK